VQLYIVAAAAIASMIGVTATALAGRQQAPPTTIRTLVLTTEPTRTLGEYTPLEAPVLKSGDSIHLYCEPGDFGWHAKNDGASFNVVATIEARGRNGRITGKAKPRAMQYQAASRPGNFFFSLSVKVEGGVGAYSLAVHLRDVTNGQVVKRVFPFVVANKRQEPPASGATTAPAPATKSGTSGERASPLDCKKYFPQVGEVISVQCTQ
jgi:hypothetical protein